jgi:hypothetical protein
LVSSRIAVVFAPALPSLTAALKVSRSSLIVSSIFIILLHLFLKVCASLAYPFRIPNGALLYPSENPVKGSVVEGKRSSLIKVTEDCHRVIYHGQLILSGQTFSWPCKDFTIMDKSIIRMMSPHFKIWYGQEINR